jgi:hypothetical protein
VELITKPSILFLDEPTSGLDSYAAYIVVNILKDLANSGCTVLCTIHQPSSEVFHLFDRILLLSEGRTLYDGSSHSLGTFLEILGLAVPAETNPADHIMFLMQTLDKERLGTICDEHEAATCKIDPHVVPPEHASAAALGGGELVRQQAGLWTQLVVLGVRDAQSVARDKGALRARLGSAVMLNLLFGMLFLGVGDTSRADYSITSHFGALVIMGMAGMMGAFLVSRTAPAVLRPQLRAGLRPRMLLRRCCDSARAALRCGVHQSVGADSLPPPSLQPILLQFPSERPRFVREYATGSYGAATYFCSKLATELPLSFVTSVIAFAIAYWMIGLRGSFILFVLIAWLVGLCAASTALLFGCVATNVQEAVQAVPVIFMPQVLFAGLFVRVDQIPAWIRWGQYLCSLKYGINLFLANEFGGGACDPAQRKQCQGLLTSSDADESLWWVYVIILLSIFFIFRLLGLVILARKARGFALA